MSGYSFDRQSVRRIAQTVRRVEGMPRHPQGRHHARGAAALVPEVFILAEDVEHNARGDAYQVEGSEFTGSVSERANDERRKLYNPGVKVWSGARVLALPAAMRGSEPEWHILHAWSATRIRGQAQTAIAPGETKTLEALVPLDGTFEPTTVDVYLPTDYVSVSVGLKVWAELVYSSSSLSSRWEVYSADCQEAA